jgi:hypothetical protein
MFLCVCVCVFVSACVGVSVMRSGSLSWGDLALECHGLNKLVGIRVIVCLYS